MVGITSLSGHKLIILKMLVAAGTVERDFYRQWPAHHPPNKKGNKMENKSYTVPEKFASATLHFMYGSISKPSQPKSVEAYLSERKFALLADLCGEGLSKEQIGAAVRSGKVNVAPVFSKRNTDLFWLPEAESELEKLAQKAQELCGGDGKNLNLPVAGDIVSIGGALKSQQLALVALAYAAHRGLIKETAMDRGLGVGNLFVSTNSPLVGLI
ncbi:MAG: hypothetical protein HY438_01380 [DPANN group archaeon]|nr:hypothetical protein [DPANN group archaeon]